MTTPTLNAKDFYVKRLKPLIGSTIVAVATDESDLSELDDLYLGLVVRTRDGREAIVWFLSDDEANHGGSFSVEFQDEIDPTEL
jgi:hypothetical protein